MSIVLFSGGRGNKSLLKAIASDENSPFQKWQVIVNGLDDGASTGAIRELLGNQCHGISDFLKVCSAMSTMPKLQSILEERLPVVRSSSDHLGSAKALYDFIFLGQDLPCLIEYKDCDDIKSSIRVYLQTFSDYFFRKNGSLPNLNNFKIGNLIFAAMLISRKLIFQNALKDFLDFCAVSRDRFDVIQSTETNSYLIGLLKSGSLLPNEAAVVLTRTTDIIESTHQLPAPLSASAIRNICSLELQAKKEYIALLEETPVVGSATVSAILHADAIIYGAGTPYSSLLPSLELGGIADGIRKAKCFKILVVNLAKETSNTMTAKDVIDSIFEYLGKSVTDGSSFVPSEYLTHIIIPHDSAAVGSSEKSIRMNKLEIAECFDWITIVEADIRASSDESKHDGFKLMNCLNAIINNG